MVIKSTEYDPAPENRKEEQDFSDMFGKAMQALSWKIYEATHDEDEWEKPIEKHPKLSVQAVGEKVEIAIRDDEEGATEKWLMTGEEMVLLLKKLAYRG